MALLRDRIDQTEPPRAAGALAAPGQHHGHRLCRIDQTRQPHRAAEARMQPELHLGKAEARIIDGDAIVAGERKFETAAETIAVDDRNRHASAAGQAGRAPRGRV